MNLSHRIIQSVEKVLLGKPETVRLAVSCFLAEGHLLIDDIPGVGKTTLALALAKAIGCEFQRIQFTSDLLPSDVLGVSVFNQKNQSFDFKPGPVFHNIVLADEINRASPKTQSALLECMQEGQVSIDNITHPLPKPFFVIATQNPHEHYGTFPLPESQLDRFMMKIALGYPNAADETAILQQDNRQSRVGNAAMIASPKEIMQEFDQVRAVKVEASLDAYIVELARRTREAEVVDLGLSPRGTLALRRAAQAFARTLDRDYVVPDDIKKVAVAVIAHRIRLKGGHYNGSSSRVADTIIHEILDQVPIPA